MQQSPCTTNCAVFVERWSPWIPKTTNIIRSLWSSTGAEVPLTKSARFCATAQRSSGLTSLCKCSTWEATAPAHWWSRTTQPVPIIALRAPPTVTRSLRFGLRSIAFAHASTPKNCPPIWPPKKASGTWRIHCGKKTAFNTWLVQVFHKNEMRNTEEIVFARFELQCKIIPLIRAALSTHIRSVAISSPDALIFELWILCELVFHMNWRDSCQQATAFSCLRVHDRPSWMLMGCARELVCWTTCNMSGLPSSLQMESVHMPLRVQQSSWILPSQNGERVFR